MNNQIKTFTAPRAFDFAPGMSLRTVLRDGQPWFAAADICAALGIKNTTRALSPLDDDEKGLHSMNTLGGDQSMTTVNESGLYSLVMRSRKPEAKAFRRWVTGTVLPSIRKDGLYIAGQETPISDDLTLTELTAQIADLQSKVDAINTARVLAWSRHQEEKLARQDAFRFLRGKAPRSRTAFR